MKVEVTDHAVVRYLERFMGVDVEKLRGQITTPDVLRTVALMGEGQARVPIGEHCRAVISNGRVVTIEGPPDKSMRPPRAANSVRQVAEEEL